MRPWAEWGSRYSGSRDLLEAVEMLVPQPPQVRGLGIANGAPVAWLSLGHQRALRLAFCAWLPWFADRLVFQHNARWPSAMAAQQKDCMAARWQDYLFVRVRPCDDSAYLTSGVSQCGALRMCARLEHRHVHKKRPVHLGTHARRRLGVYNVRQDPPAGPTSSRRRTTSRTDSPSLRPLVGCHLCPHDRRRRRRTLDRGGGGKSESEEGITTPDRRASVAAANRDSRSHRLDYVTVSSICWLVTRSKSTTGKRSRDKFQSVKPMQQ